MEQDRLVINTALSSLNAAAAAANPKIVESVETIWNAILKLRAAFPGISLYADILAKEEWCKLPSNPRIGDKIGDFSDREIMRFMKEELADAEFARPFVGELIWSLFFVYRAFVLRIVTIVEINYSKGILPYWYEDKGIQEFIKILLTEDEIRAVERYEVSRYQQARALAESKILAEMNRVISGHRSADSGLAHASKMLRAVAEVEGGQK